MNEETATRTLVRAYWDCPEHGEIPDSEATTKWESAARDKVWVHTTCGKRLSRKNVWKDSDEESAVREAPNGAYFDRQGLSEAGRANMEDAGRGSQLW